MFRYFIISAVLAILTLLYFFNPEGSVFHLKCPFFVLTGGYYCPSCGIQRVIHNLLHFNFAEAFWYNPFVFIISPYFILLIITTWFDTKKKMSKLKNFCYNYKTIIVFLVVMAIWWIIRNVFPVFYIS